MESSAHLRRKDTTKGPPLRILSLDGGGVRGYSMLVIIQELMHRTYVEINGKAPRRNQIPKPADHFDLIIGSGTGGIIAIMLGRLRLDLETCMELYLRTSKNVFETDKRIAGIPYTSTLFKASRLEESMREGVMEHTISQSEGNDGSEHQPASKFQTSSLKGHRYHSRNSSMASLSSRASRRHSETPFLATNLGNPDALMYDKRENRTKTAVTAIYQGTRPGGQAALLRSYDSRKEPPSERECTIWQAGRATTASVLAFKPIQIGQSVFIDEGAGKFNPAPDALEEACVNEWPSREVGVFVSIGTGKRTPGSEKDSHLWYEDFIGEFADFRRRLMTKIEECTKIHDYMIREGLAKYRVNPENYYRLNVEVGVGEFQINEWTRIADISTSTHRYLARPDIQRVNIGIASKLARINQASLRNEIDRVNYELNENLATAGKPLKIIHEPYPNAVELPADDIPYKTSRTSLGANFNGKLELQFPTPSRTTTPRQSLRNSNGLPKRRFSDVAGLPAGSYNPISSENDRIAIINNEYSKLRDLSINRIEPPPLPPKLYIEKPHDMTRPLPPYPLDDEPPPVVDKSRKPSYKYT